MNKIEAKEFLPMVKALADGKIIQIKDKYDEWKDLKAPSFCEEVCNYRIKPEPKLVPFTFEDNPLFRDRWIVLNKTGSIWRIEVITRNAVYINGSRCSYDLLFRQYKFDDGSPCGKYVEE